MINFFGVKTMNAKLFALTALSVLALAACGGGGGSDSPVQTTQETKQPNNVQQQQQQKPQQQSQQQSQQQQPVTGKLDVEYDIYRNGREINDDDAAEDRYQQNRLNVMNLDGREFVIIPNKQTSIVSRNENGANGLVGGGELMYARYGVLSFSDKNDKKDYIFVQGIESQKTKKWDMPNTNGVKYSGNAVAYRISDGKKDQGTVTFTANFADRNPNMNGVIKLNTFGTFTYNNIKIDGNDFEGGSGARKIEGDFYGEKAKEMAGEFKVNGIKGVFGAKKQ